MNALRCYGGVRRIAFLSPYWPVMNDIVRHYFQKAGLALHAPSWTGIAAFTTAECRQALRRLDGDDVDALDQGGFTPYMLPSSAGRGVLRPRTCVSHSRRLPSDGVDGQTTTETGAMGHEHTSCCHVSDCRSIFRSSRPRQKMALTNAGHRAGGVGCSVSVREVWAKNGRRRTSVPGLAAPELVVRIADYLRRAGWSRLTPFVLSSTKQLLK